MRSITKLAPRDPADEATRHIVTKVYEHVFKSKLAEVADKLQEKLNATKDCAHARSR